MPPTVLFFPFGPGLHQENDNRLQEPGNPRAVENLIRTKNGRLRARRDYETLGMTVNGYNRSGSDRTITELRLYDLHNYGRGIVAFGRSTAAFMNDYAEAIDSSQEIYSLVEQPANVWSRPPTPALGVGTLVRKMGRVGRRPSSITKADVAAGGGRVCLVMDVILRPDTGSVSSVAGCLIDAATDVTLCNFEIADADRPRVCFVEGKFFITYVITATGAIGLSSLDPATGTTLVSLTSPVAAGASVVAHDLSASITGSGFWIGVCRSDTTTALRGCTSAGAVTYTAAGPAVLGDAITVLHHADGGTSRLHVCIVRDTTLNIDLYTYKPPATAPDVSSVDIESTFNADAQVSLALDDKQSAGVTPNLLLQYSASFSTTIELVTSPKNYATHASVSGTSETKELRLNSKAITVKGRTLVGCYIAEEADFDTPVLMRTNDTTNGNCLRPVCVVDHFLAHAADIAHLPSTAYDSSTDLVYWLSLVEDEDRFSSVQICEMRIAGQDRRQTVLLGDVLYVAGAIVQAFDGRGAYEAGGFLTRPFMPQPVSSATVGGLESPGIYQMIAVSSYRDAKGRRIQSAPSNLTELDFGGLGDTSIRAKANPGLTLRDTQLADKVTADGMQSAPAVEMYRTLNTADGNGTFHLDLASPVPRAALNSLQSLLLIQSDVDISDNPIIYTQGKRGALSGPLEFVCPDPAISLSASADKILSGGLPEESRIQESRPLFVSEQVQWSDTLGFYRDVSGRVLAVARLDERRIIWTDTQVLEADGPGLDDNGLGDIGAPRRLPSDVGLYGGVLGWRSIVEISAGILFQGLRNQIYLLPRGGVTPTPVGFAVEELLDAYPDISAAEYLSEDQTVRFCCNNEAGTESIILLFNVRFLEWFTEGPYSFAIRAAAKASGRFYLLTSSNTVLRQSVSDPPTTFVPTAWRAGVIHPFKPGMFGKVYAYWFYGTFRGNCRLRAVARWDDGELDEHEYVDVIGLEDGAQFVYRFEFDQSKCESCTIDFETIDFQGEATAGLEYNYWGIEQEPSGVPNQIGPEGMS